MIWIRRVASAPLLLLALVCSIGAVRIFSGNLPGSSAGEGVMAAIFAAATGAPAYWLLLPDIRRLGGLSGAQVRQWLFANPLSQAALLWLAAAVTMAAAPKLAILPGFVAFCAYSVLSPWSAFSARRWWVTSLLALLGFALLMFGLAATAEALTPRGFGEAGMIFLLPMEGFPILLVLSGIARWLRKPKPATQ